MSLLEVWKTVLICYKNFHISTSCLYTGWMGSNICWRY